MSIGRRLINLVRANLNMVLDRNSWPDFDAGGDSLRIENLTDEQLEKELQRRRRRREAVENAAKGGYSPEDWEEVERTTSGAAGRYRSSRHKRKQGGAAGSGQQGSARMGGNKRISQLYAQLECPYGSDLTTVRRHYRMMMRKYHPDMHSNNPDKQRIATELSQRLTMAYNELSQHLGGR